MTFCGQTRSCDTIKASHHMCSLAFFTANSCSLRWWTGVLLPSSPFFAPIPILSLTSPSVFVRWLRPGVLIPLRRRHHSARFPSPLCSHSSPSRSHPTSFVLVSEIPSFLLLWLHLLFLNFLVTSQMKLLGQLLEPADPQNHTSPRCLGPWQTWPLTLSLLLSICFLLKCWSYGSLALLSFFILSQRIKHGGRVARELHRSSP